MIACSIIAVTWILGSVLLYTVLVKTAKTLPPTVGDENVSDYKV